MENNPSSSSSDVEAGLLTCGVEPSFSHKRTEGIMSAARSGSQLYRVHHDSESEIRKLSISNQQLDVDQAVICQ